MLAWDREPCSCMQSQNRWRQQKSNWLIRYEFPFPLIVKAFSKIDTGWVEPNYLLFSCASLDALQSLFRLDRPTCHYFSTNYQNHVGGNLHHVQEFLNLCILSYYFEFWYWYNDINCKTSSVSFKNNQTAVFHSNIKRFKFMLIF